MNYLFKCNDIGDFIRRSFTSLFSFALLSIFSVVTYADEGGVPFWLSGEYSSMSAVPPVQGWSVIVLPYVYNGSAEKTANFQHGQSINAGVNARESLGLVQLGYATEEKLLGGVPYIGVAWGPGANTTTAFASLTGTKYEANRANSTTGVTDLYPQASLSWNKGNDNYMTYLTGDVPIGTYNPATLSSLGIGHAAVDVGGGYTYLNNTTGLEYSGVLGATYNLMNNQTNYQNGVDSHFDWDLSHFLSEHWQVGIAGYVYYQLTADSGSGDLVGAFKSRVAAAGPEVGYAFNVNNKPAYANLRFYKEFWAQNRVQGYATIATISIPLGK
jgi:hypothetical protein